MIVSPANKLAEPYQHQLLHQNLPGYQILLQIVMWVLYHTLAHLWTKAIFRYQIFWFPHLPITNRQSHDNPDFNHRLSALTSYSSSMYALLSLQLSFLQLHPQTLSPHQLLFLYVQHRPSVPNNYSFSLYIAIHWERMAAGRYLLPLFIGLNGPAGCVSGWKELGPCKLWV